MEITWVERKLRQFDLEDETVLDGAASLQSSVPETKYLDRVQHRAPDTYTHTHTHTHARTHTHE